MDAPAQYLEELRGELSLYPTWLPGDEMELGAFGTLKRGKFYTHGRLRDLDVELIAKETANKTPIAKSRGIKFGAKTSTESNPGMFDASLGIEIEFVNELAWAFCAKGVSSVEIENIFQVERAVLEARRSGLWDAEYLLVTELRRVDKLTVLVARSKNVRAQLRARGAFKTPVDLVLAEDATIERTSEDVFIVDRARNTTPLYGIRKLKGVFSKALVPVAGGKAKPRDDEELELLPAKDEPFGS